MGTLEQSDQRAPDSEPRQLNEDSRAKGCVSCY